MIAWHRKRAALLAILLLVNQPIYAGGLCIYPRLVGICIWIWPYPLDISVSIKIGHFNPDVFVYVNREGLLSTQDNPIYPSKGSAADDNERGHKDLMFKHASAIGNPLSGEIYCPTQADTTPYFTSEIDIPSWKWVGLDSLDSASLIPGEREIEGDDDNWGALYPRSGWVIQQSDPRTAGVIAQRVGDIITRESEPHIYDDDLASQSKIFIEDEMFTWAPGELIENKFDEGWWERISPDFNIQCDIFGEEDSDEAIDEEGDYIYLLWRPYTCCEVEAGFLIYIDFMKYPS